MVRTIIKGYLNVNYRIAGQNSGFHSSLYTLVDCGNVFLGNSAADNLVDELVALAGLVGFELDLNVTILTLTAGLTGILMLDVCKSADSLLISNLRCAYVCFDLELTQKSVYDDFEVGSSSASFERAMPIFS